MATATPAKTNPGAPAPAHTNPTAPKKARNVLTPEQRAAKLKELAAPRMGRALRALKHVSQLARYSPTEAQAAKILDALKAGLKSCEGAFSGHVQAEFEL